MHNDYRTTRTLALEDRETVSQDAGPGGGDDAARNPHHALCPATQRAMKRNGIVRRDTQSDRLGESLARNREVRRVENAVAGLKGMQGEVY